MSLSSVLADAGGATRVIVRSIAFVSAIVVIGTSAFRWVVVESAARARIRTAETDRQVATIGMFAAAVLTITAPWRILGQADAFMSPGDPLLPVLITVLKTAWGRAAAIQVAAALIALAGFWMARNMALRGWTVALWAAALMTVTPAWMGHAAATESQSAIAIGTDVLHVAAAGGWGGAVIVLALLLGHLKRQATGGVTAAELIARFRTLALVSAATLVATGVVSSIFRLTSPVDLFTSPYGLMLTTKVLLVAGAVLVGRHNSRTAASRARNGGAEAVIRSIGAEAVLFVLVVSLSSLLSASPPPGD